MSSPIRIRCICVATVSLILLLGTAVTQAQQTINVPAGQPTIQAAINAANNGDTVLVAPGTYLENINFGGKAITVASSGGPSVTTIDGGAQGSVVTFSSGEPATSVLNGFTIRNGLQNGLFGGGIYIASSSPTITGNIVTGNHAAVGCGIYVNGGSPLIQSNTITANDQTGAGDGGQGGGGILISGSNTAPAAPQIIGNAITNNSVAAGGNGGGISVGYFSSPLIQGNMIQGNKAYNFGGGVALQSYNSPILVQNLIVNNTALGGGSGGGLYVSPGDNPTEIINNTIAANSAYDNTSAVYVTGFGQNATFTNNIFVAAASQSAVTCNSTYSSISPVFSYNDAFSASGSAWAGICEATTNPGNLSSDPLFMSPANNDFHLQAASPAVNAGNNGAPNLPTTDFDGNPRIVGTIDLGVYEVVNTSAANISPNSLSFAGQAIGTSSTPQSASLTSTGSTGFQITSFQIAGNFSATTTCPTLGQPGGFSGVASGNACIYSVSFTPSANAPLTGTLIVNGTNGASLVVSLSGTGLSPNPSASLSTTSLQFPLQQVGTTSAPQPVMLTNSGASALSIAGITASQQFSETDNCGSSLTGGASCTINVSFAPTTSGNSNGTLNIVENAGGSTQTVTLNGQAGTPIAMVSPGTLNFGSQVLGSTSASQNVTLSNTGNFTLTLNSIAVSGDFAQNNNCGSALAPNASCVISVTFTPQSSGSSSGTIPITDNASGSPQSVSLSGTGLTPAAVSLSPSSLSFSTPLGTSSASQTVTVTNTGGVALGISSVAANYPFEIMTNTCTGNLAGGASCSVNISYTAQTSGAVTGAFTITDSAAGSPQSVPLTGTTPATVSLSAASLTFSGQLIGTTSAAQTVTLTNTGGTSLSVSSIATSQPFAETNNCPVSLAGGASCSITVTFTPQTRGNSTGGVTISDSASGSPQSVSLSGTGLTPAAVSLSASSLTFPGQVVGTTSTVQTVVLTNTGGASLSISGIVTNQPFAETNNCPASLAGGASCTMSITFTPQSSGSSSGTISITDNDTGSPQSVSLSGTGLTPAAVSLSPSSLSFSTPLGTSSASQAITVTNTGGAALGISSIAANYPFEIMTSTCTGSLAGGASCSVNISFTPQTSSSVTGAFTITDNASGSPQSVPLTGTTPAAVALSPSSLTFSSQAIGTTSAAQTVTLTNTGGTSLSISSIATSQPFAETNNCPVSLAGGASCSITVTFTPHTSGIASGAVTISDNAAGSPQSFTLTGTTPAIASLSPSSLTFSATVIGSTATQTVTLTNKGGANMNITNLTYANPFSVPSENCLGTLAGGASCQITVAFTPTASGPASGVLQITDTATGSPQGVSLSGTGITPAAVSLNTSTLSFGPQLVATTSAAQTVTLTNTGSASLSISGIATSQPFAETTNCPASLDGGASCTISVTFTPRASGAVNGAVTISDSAAGSPHTVSLTGNGLDFSVSVTPASVTITSGAKANYTVTVSELGGSFNHNVSLSCSGLPAQSSCSFSPSGLTPGSGSAGSALTIKTTKANGTSGTQPGTYTITITGNSNPLVHSTTVTLVVN